MTVLLIGALPANLARGAALYRVQDLGNRTPSAISNNGTFVGGAGSSAFIHTSAGYASLPASFSSVIAVNDAGEVIGTKFVIGGHFTGIVYRNGQVVEIPAPAGQQYTLPVSINSSGQVAGRTETWNNGTIYGGFIWSGSGVAIDPGLGQIHALTDAGDYGGGPLTSGQAWVMRTSQLAIFNHAPLPKNSSVEAMNGDGIAAVRASMGGGIYKAFLWDVSSDSITEIVQPGTWSDVDPDGINRWGTVIGRSYGYPASRPFVYQGGVFYYLDDVVDKSLGWAFLGATGINDAGQIIGTGKHNGVTAGFLLTPVPEPSSLATLLLLGVGAVLSRARGHRGAAHVIPAASS